MKHEGVDAVLRQLEKARCVWPEPTTDPRAVGGVEQPGVSWMSQDVTQAADTSAVLCAARAFAESA